MRLATMAVIVPRLAMADPADHPATVAPMPHLAMGVGGILTGAAVAEDVPRAEAEVVDTRLAVAAAATLAVAAKVDVAGASQRLQQMWLM